MSHAKTLHEAQFRKVLHYCCPQQQIHREPTIFIISFFAELRAREIAALTLEDVFQAGGRVRSELILESTKIKEGHRWSAFINNRLAKALDEYCLVKTGLVCRFLCFKVKRAGTPQPTLCVSYF